jgi:acrylyl-CoA reductase (NADPH)
MDSVNCPMPLRQEVWRRLASDMRPPHLARMTRTVPFDQLPTVFDDFIASRVKGRLVIDIGGSTSSR